MAEGAGVEEGEVHGAANQAAADLLRAAAGKAEISTVTADFESSVKFAEEKVFCSAECLFSLPLTVGSAPRRLV